MELGLSIATGAFEYARYFSVVKTLNIVKEKDAAIPRRHGGQGSIDVEAVDYPGLRQITKAETASGDRGTQQKVRACASTSEQC